jgi:tRNA-specific 2-thiouridylase
MTKALAIISGDIDSLVAAKSIKDQGIDVAGVSFKSAFFSYEASVKQAEALDIDLKIVDLTEEHLRMIKDEIMSYKGNMDFCIGCNLLKIAYAAKLLKDIDGDFIVSGETLNKKILSPKVSSNNVLIKGINMNELVLRPLSANRLEPTIMEQSGVVDRDKLVKLSQNLQSYREELAKELGINSYSHYKGECKLKNPDFTYRLKEFFAYNNDCKAEDVEKLN